MYFVRVLIVSYFDKKDDNMLYNPFTVWRDISELTTHCALPMGLNTKELLNTTFFCSSSMGSSEALHAV